MPSCAIGGCLVSTKTKLPSEGFDEVPRSVGLRLFTPPAELVEKWATKCGRKDVDSMTYQQKANLRYCSKHFALSSYDLKIVDQYEKVPKNKRPLVAAACPEFYLPHKKDSTDQAQRDVRAVKRSRSPATTSVQNENHDKKLKKKETEDLKDFENEADLEVGDGPEMDGESSSASMAAGGDFVLHVPVGDYATNNGFKHLKLPYSEPLKWVSADLYGSESVPVYGNLAIDIRSGFPGDYVPSSLLKDVHSKFKNLSDKNKKLIRKCQELEKKLADQELQNQDIKEELRKAKAHELSIMTSLLSHLTEAQINRIVGNSRTQWSAEDYKLPIVLLGLCHKSYELLVRKIPFPCVRSVQRFVAQYEISPGIMEMVIDLMSANDLSTKEKLVWLTFDEVMVRRKAAYSSNEDRVYAPSRQMQVILARGLFSDWKNPVFFDFDVAVTKDILDEVIMKLDRAGFTVVGLSCDMGKQNEHLLFKTLGITPENPTFKNPAKPDWKIYCIFDTPHLLKLCRNHLLNNGYEVDKVPIKKDALHDLVEVGRGAEIVPHDVTLEHLLLQGPDRQRVRPAAQLLSLKTAEALETAVKDGHVSSKGALVLYES